MKSKKLTGILATALVLAVIAGVSVYAASNYGTSADPLVAKSYLDDVLTPELMDKVQDEIDAAAAAVEKKMDSVAGGETDTYKVVTLSKGQTITGEVGCEVMLRIGTATCRAVYNPGLIDVTGGASLNAGSALTANHLYMVTIEGGGITATATTVKVLIRGSYTIG